MEAFGEALSSFYHIISLAFFFIVIIEIHDLVGRLRYVERQLSEIRFELQRENDRIEEDENYYT